VVLFFERHQHFLDLDGGLAEEVAARKVGGVKDQVLVGFVDRRYGLEGVVDCDAARAVLGAHGRGGWGNSARGLIVRAWLGEGSISGGGDKSKELLLGRKKFGIDFLEKSEMANQLLGEGGDAVGEVGDRWEDVDGLVAAADRVSTSTRATHSRGASRRVRPSLADWLRPALRQALRRRRLGRLHRGRRG
jgi:hypothetical protein